MDILLNNEKYILAYIDNEDVNINIINNVFEKLKMKIVLIKSSYDEFNLNNDIVIQIIPDYILEYQLLYHCQFIIYLSKFKRSNVITDYFNKNYKVILWSIFSMEDNISCIEQDYGILEYTNNNDNTDIKNFLEKYSTYEEYSTYSKINILNKTIYNDNKQINKNIEININKIINNSDKLINNPDKITGVTVFKHGDNMVETIQLTCLLENLHNTNINKILVICNQINDKLKEIIDNHPNRIIIYNKDNNITYKDILEIITEYIPINTIVYLFMCDIILPNQNTINNICFDLNLSNKNEVYSLSRLDKMPNNTIVRSDILCKLLCSTEHDAWLFKTPLILNSTSLDKLSNIYFYNYLSSIFFNNEIKENNYILINNTKEYKILRLMLDNQIYNRPLIDKNINLNLSNELNNIYLLPSNEILDNISIEQLIKIMKPNSDEIDNYIIKCELFNKYMKNKIINNI